MTGTLIDCCAIALGTTIGTIANSKLKKCDCAKKVLQTLALCALLVGIVGCCDVSNPIVAILSLVVGGLIGNGVQLEKRIVWLLNKCSTLLSKTSMDDRSIEGFISYSLLSIVGSMSVIGALQNGLTGDISTLITKSVLDLICAILFGASFGMSIIFSIPIVLVYQGFFAYLAVIISPVITASVLGDMSAVGSMLIICAGLNLIDVGGIKPMNLVPAIFLPILIHQIIT